jgi:CheY-like chemotaxis protein
VKFQAPIADKCTVTHTLLLADDSVTIQRVIELTFADEDVQVIAVSDGDQAIARLESAPPDIVLADIGMPGKNGYEVAKYVKQSPKLSHIPVVLLTGAFEPVDQARAAEVGCDGVLAKPFEPQLVIGRVKELLSAEAHVATAAPAVPALEPAANHGPAELDDYFDRLDVAFSKLSGGTRPLSDSKSGTIAAADIDGVPDGVGESPASVADEIDRYVAEHSEGPTPELSLSPEPVLHAAEPPRVETPVESTELRAAPMSPPAELTSAAPSSIPRPIPVPSVSAPAVSPVSARTVSPSAGAASSTFPSIADAFAAILAAEQAEPSSAARPVWPILQAPPVAEPTPPVPLELTDEEIDRIVGRVIDRMSDRVVRETVTGIASDTAERLVREEIERIKNAIK